MQGARDLPAGPLPARLSERRSTPGRRTSALSKVETDSALERLRTKDVRRATSPFDAPVPVNAAGGIRKLGPPRLSGDRRRGDDRQTFRTRDAWSVTTIRPDDGPCVDVRGRNTQPHQRAY